MAVTEIGFGAMARMLIDLADRFAEGRIAFLLEGGYDLAALRNSAGAVLKELQTPKSGLAEQLTAADSGT